MIFVFGSNFAGSHGAGAALFAFEKHGAIMGQMSGRQGNSYAIPTCDSFIFPLQLAEIQIYVEEFINYAKQVPNEDFQVTRIGCGIAGFTDAQIAPLFEDAPVNCLMPPEWAKYYPNHRIWN